MLRSLQSRNQVVQPFVCFQCLAKYHQESSINSSRRSESRSPRNALEHARPREFRRQFHATHVTRSSVEAQTATSSPQELPLSSSRPNIRDRLRQWETEHKAAIEFIAIPEDKIIPGEARNRSPYLDNNDFSGEAAEPNDTAVEPISLDFERFDMVDVGDSRSFLLPGDLVELLTVGNQRQELAIFVRELGKQAQFYSMSGRWVNRVQNPVAFFVPGFVSTQELDYLRPFLPDEEVDTSMEGKLQSFNESVPVDVGQPLKRKMMEFWNEAGSVYQSAATNLDSAHRSVADIFHYKYCSLVEIAGQVLPKSVPKNKDGKYGWAALYAVHRALLKDDIGFTPVKLSAMRSNPRYEINGFSEVDCIRRVVGWVRKYTDTLLGQGKEVTQASRAPSPETYEFVEFAKGARRLIDLSRANRPFTSHGTIGPSLITLEPGQNFRSGTPRAAFTASDMLFIRFLESWSCLGSFSPHSSLHAVGSTILRMVDRYPDQTLNFTTAWTCLQELGAIPPWENKTTFDLRLPYAGRQDAIMHRLHPTANSSGGVVKDKFAAIRKKWGRTPVYCVDDAEALEIDDGFSLEATDEPDVYWVHVHIADPAAHLDPRGLLAQFAERVAETVYLPDRVVAMLPPGFTRAHLSLGTSRPCLTFSTKMNLQGEMLDSKITAGVVENVKYLTKETFREITLGSNSVEYDFYVVGSYQPKPVTRPLLGSDQFSEEEKENLKILRAIGDARRKKLRARGGIGTGNPYPLVSVSFNGHPWRKPKNFTDSLQFFGDPTISVGIEKRVAGNLLMCEQIDTVGDIMVMAGEMAARWCSERSIPIPYRITPRNPEKQDPSEYFQQTVLPAQDENGKVPEDVMHSYFSLIGKVQPSTTPGPHVALGVDVFARVTSPLRRFADLVAHWQIEAALLHEASTGQSLVGKSEVGYLPFSQAQLDDMLPHLSQRERLINSYTRMADRLTQLQCVLRAWKFGEAELPNPLVLTARSINPDVKTVGGVLRKLLLGGQMVIPPGVDMETLQIGDRFEVEIEDVNVYRNALSLKYVQQLESESELEDMERGTQ